MRHLIIFPLVFSLNFLFGNDEVIEVIRNRVEFGNVQGKIEIGSSGILALKGVSTFYSNRGFTPVWLNANKPAENVKELLRAIDAAESDGLNPKDYHLTRIKTL
jgi:hypothetical protein